MTPNEWRIKCQVRPIRRKSLDFRVEMTGNTILPVVYFSRVNAVVLSN